MLTRTALAVLCVLILPALGALASPAAAPSAFDAVRGRLAAVPVGSPLAPLAAREQASLDAAEAFRAALGLPAGPERSAALLALAGGDAGNVPPIAFDRPSEAFAAVARSRGVAVDADALAALDSHPLAGPLLDVAGRFLQFQQAAQAAYGPLAQQGAAQIAALESQMDAAPDWTPEDALAFSAAAAGLPAVPAPALANLLDARAALVVASSGLADAARSLAGPRESQAQVFLPPAIALDLDGVDSSYPVDIALVIDVGGNDLYLNNAGGSNVDPLMLRCINLPPTGSTAAGAAALIDLGGDDRHESYRNCGINGGGRLGAGFLYDAGGRDTYYASTGGTNGGGWLGLGFLYDGGSGDDTYLGLASTGRYGAWGVNGGGMGQGQGFLLDEDGADSYTAGTGGTNGGGYLEGGRGLLVDAGGADLFAGDWLGTNGGGNEAAAGALLDGGGDDQYKTSIYIQFGYGANGGAAAATGLLYDAGGSDTYSALDSGTNGGASAGVGLLLDEGGNDHYTATGTTGNGAAFGGLALLWDRAGSDTYSDGLVDCTDCDVVPKGLVGAQLDD